MVREIHLGVTGLQHSGKTVFLTALAYQLSECGSEGLDYFAAQGVELFPGTLLPTDGLGDIQRYLGMLRNSPPNWPERTTAEGELAIEFAYRDHRKFKSAIRRRLPHRTVNRIRLHLHDYPGEYLLDVDLVRLGLNFDTWSAQTLHRIAGQSHQDYEVYVKRCAEFLAPAIDVSTGSDAEAGSPNVSLRQLVSLKRAYAELVVQLHRRGCEMLQPGMALTALATKTVEEIASKLPFGPLPAGHESPLRPVLREAFENYVKEQVTPFVKRLGRCDRQLVLIDVLRILRQGKDSYNDTRACLWTIIGAYSYANSWLAKLGSKLPKWCRPDTSVGRVVLAATKADHASKQSRANLPKLLNRLAARFEGDLAEVDRRQTLFLASLRSTEDVRCEEKGISWALKGHKLSGESDGDRELFPGDVPEDWSDETFCKQRERAFPDFRPRPVSGVNGTPWPHLNMDHVMWSILFD